MKLDLYQIDAFAKKAFEGNPAAVVPLMTWLSDEVMQSIAAENNLAETAFFVPTDTGFYIRWFTPTKEIALCGHATLASAFVLYEYLDYQQNQIEFDSLSGILKVQKKADCLILDFPNQRPAATEISQDLITGLGMTPSSCFESEDIIAVLDNEADVIAITPDFDALSKLPLRGVIVTAPANDYDFVARFFAPKYGIPEDPVTGSAYTQLAPYWAECLDKNTLTAKQLSARGGELECTVVGDRVLISGHAVSYLQGEINI